MTEHPHTTWLIGTPEGCNLGDHAIAVGTHRWMEAALGEADTRCVEVTETQWRTEKSEICKAVKPGDTVLLQGGGNMGNLWPTEEHIRREAIAAFPENRVVVMPQSVFYTNDYPGREALLASVRIYAKHPNLTLCARERASGDLMRRIYPHATVYDMPDMAMRLRVAVPPAIDRSGILVIARDDKERLVSPGQWREIVAMCQALAPTRRESTMAPAPLTVSTREAAVYDCLKRFSQARLVVTDRLHGMILAAIAGTPCVALPSLTGKTKAVHDTWFRGRIEQIMYTGDLSDIGDWIRMAAEPAGITGETFNPADATVWSEIPLGM